MSSDKPVSGSDSTALAVDRTAMAADRSLMAWIRTGLAQIGFGFTIYKFLQYAQEQMLASGQAAAANATGPRMVGLFVIGLGVLSLTFGILENLATIRGLRRTHTLTHARYSLVMAGVVLALGIALFVGILLRISGVA